MLRSLIGLAAAFVATTAFAQERPERPQPLGVWDATGAFVGTSFALGQVVISFNGTPVLFDFDPGGHLFTQDQSFAFTSNNCSGTPYILVINGLLPASGVIVGGSVFYPTKITQLQFGSVMASPSSPCIVESGTSYAGVATQAALPKVTPPLCVSATRIRCQ